MRHRQQKKEKDEASARWRTEGGEKVCHAHAATAFKVCSSELTFLHLSVRAPK